MFLSYRWQNNNKNKQNSLNQARMLTLWLFPLLHDDKQGFLPFFVFPSGLLHSVLHWKGAIFCTVFVLRSIFLILCLLDMTISSNFKPKLFPPVLFFLWILFALATGYASVGKKTVDLNWLKTASKNSWTKLYPSIYLPFICLHHQ